MSHLLPTVLSVLSMYLNVAQTGLLENQPHLIINQEEVSLNHSMVICSSSCEFNFRKLPRNIRKHFRIVSSSPPDMVTMLETGLIKSGMLLSTKVATQIADFLNTVKEIFPCFMSGFGVQRLKDMNACFHMNFKEMLKCKDGQKIANELSSVMEISESNEFVLDDIQETLPLADSATSM